MSVVEGIKRRLDLVADEVAGHVEAILIAEHLRAEHRADTVLARLEGQLAQRLSGEPTPCPLLDDGACSVYEVRPAVCRAVVRRDLETCLAEYHAHGVAALGSDSDIEAFHRALDGHERVDLALALRHLLPQPEARRRFIDFEDVLAPVYWSEDAQLDRNWKARFGEDAA